MFPYPAGCKSAPVRSGSSQPAAPSSGLRPSAPQFSGSMATALTAYTHPTESGAQTAAESADTAAARFRGAAEVSDEFVLRSFAYLIYHDSMPSQMPARQNSQEKCNFS